MTNYREILRLQALGMNKQETAASIGCSRNTVAEVLRRSKELKLSYPLPDEMTDAKLATLLYPSATSKPIYKMPDYEYVAKEMMRDGVTLNLLWLEYCEKCLAAGETPYQSTQFNKHYGDYLAKANATMHLNHKPGEIMQVDWAGDTASVIDTDTGETIPVYVFVATLPYSGYSYVEAFFSMNQECWTSAHVNAYRYFGGVSRIIQCDNLKTGVIKHGKSEITLNKSYQELAEHYGTAILPARVRSPKDKAMVEGTVGVISTFILAALRNQQFLSLSELNNAIVERLYEFNHKPFQKKDGSRAIEFEEEKPFLLPLPMRPFELSVWKIATVGPNYHIAVDGMNYSVPYEYIKQKVDVRITRSIVEVFFGGNRICSHTRLYGRQNQYSTTESHMPEKHQQYAQWNGDRFRSWADKIGIETKTVVSAILSGYKVEQQGYDELTEKMTAAKQIYDTSRSQLKPIESRIKEIDCIIHDIEVYRQTKPVADKLETVALKERYRREHESELILFKAAEKSLRPYLKDGKLPLIKELRAEQQSLYAEKDKLYQQYGTAKSEQKELDVIMKNVDMILGRDNAQEREAQKKRSGELE